MNTVRLPHHRYRQIRYEPLAAILPAKRHRVSRAALIAVSLIGLAVAAAIWLQ